MSNPGDETDLKKKSRSPDELKWTGCWRTTRSCRSCRNSLLLLLFVAVLAATMIVFDFESLQFDLATRLKRREAAAEETSSYVPAEMLLAPSPVSLLNQDVGSVQRICHDDSSDVRGCLVNTGGSCDVMRPMVIRPRPWMSPLLQEEDLILYYSSHARHKDGHDVNINGIRRGRGVDLPGVELSFPDSPPVCRTVHSPSIVVSDEERMLYMYVNGNTCETFKWGSPERGPNSMSQPVVLFVSRDGIEWRLRRPDQPLEGHAINGSSPFQLHHHFYLSLPVKHSDGFHYALAKTQTSGPGSARLCRAPSLSGPFEEGPILAQAVRHADTLIRGSQLYVFYTLIMDTPERIFMATVHLDDLVDWKRWKLLPGPTLLTPEFAYEHGNAELVPSNHGPGKCKPNRQVRDPRFLPDVDSEDDSGRLSGLLFYAVRGEGGIAHARLSVDLDKYQRVVANRLPGNIDQRIVTASSFEKASDVASGKVLVTGTGRSGTTFLCQAFQAINIKISHDNDVDCGPYPGPDGAVSWYDAFRNQGEKFRYTHILLVVRHPLDTIESRKVAASHRTPNYGFYFWKIGKWADLSDLQLESGNEATAEEIERRLYAFSLKFYIRWNSFAERHASWIERTEDIQGDSLPLWRLCMAGHFGERCPDLETIRTRLEKVPSHLNSGFSDVTLSERQKKFGRISTREVRRKLSWEKLEDMVGPDDRRYVLIAKQMAVAYGYESQDAHPTTRYHCDFVNGTTHWDCFLD